MEITAAVAVAVASLAAWLGFALAGWPGELNACVAAGTCFCEGFRAGLVRQPANTWSNLGFVAMGLAVATHSVRRRREPPRRSNPMTTRVGPPALYAAVVVFLGPGSMFLHGSMTRWGGQVDVASMYLFAAFAVVYAVVRWRGLGWDALLAGWAALSAVLVISKLTLPVSSDVVFGLVLAAAVGLETLAVRRRQLAMRTGWAAAAGAVFAVAFAIWLPSRTLDGALCDPDSLLQGHAAWHLLCAVATGCIYAYYRSEEPAPA